MARERVGRMILAVMTGYVTNAVLVGATEVIYVRFIDSRKYFMVDLMTQVVATILGGYLCSLIAQGRKRIAAASLTVLGLLIGTVSLVTSWHGEPHWYGIALLSVYAPCVWAGYGLVRR
jgi:hypothetical protein